MVYHGEVFFQFHATKPTCKKTSSSGKHCVDISRPCGNTNPPLLQRYVALRQPHLSYNNTRVVVTKAAENNDTMSRKSPRGKVWELDMSHRLAPLKEKIAHIPIWDDTFKTSFYYPLFWRKRVFINPRSTSVSFNVRASFASLVPLSRWEDVYHSTNQPVHMYSAATLDKLVFVFSWYNF